MSKEAVNEYVNSSIQDGKLPLPILGRITEKTGELNLVYYKLNEGNVSSFAKSFKFLVPSRLKKLVLIDNSIKDENCAEIVEALADNRLGGLQTLTFMQNGFGEYTIKAFGNSFI